MADLNILMVAAENDAVPDAKVGGIGDVVRDVPPALAAQGHTVTVITPAYGTLADLPGAIHLTDLAVSFGGVHNRVGLYEVPAKHPVDGVRHLALDHPQFSVCGTGRIYCSDLPDTPFASDATKFALFSAAVAKVVSSGAIDRPDVLHLHDWHAAFLLILRAYDPSHRDLRGIRTVFSIHNLALQGVRPFSGHESSLDAWYPGLAYDEAALVDPRWDDCLNPMAIGIRLADTVHTVSPSYAEEIMAPSDVAGRGYYGGEGLEDDLARAHAEGRMHGILNGCEYPDVPAAPLDWDDLVALMRGEILRWVGTTGKVSPAHFIAMSRLEDWSRKRPGILLTSVSRITDQKLRLLHERDTMRRPALEALLETLGDRGVYVVLGNGDAVHEQFLMEVASRRSNMVFLKGYSQAVAEALYAAGDLFLMPSSFEPCGISQMLAMRAGQPCLVHHVGGLRDTVKAGKNGFAFTGGNMAEQARGMELALAEALRVWEKAPARWKGIGTKAPAARFRWSDAVTDYVDLLYTA